MTQCGLFMKPTASIHANAAGVCILLLYLCTVSVPSVVIESNHIGTP